MQIHCENTWFLERGPPGDPNKVAPNGPIFRAHFYKKAMVFTYILYITQNRFTILSTSMTSIFGHHFGKNIWFSQCCLLFSARWGCTNLSHFRPRLSRHRFGRYIWFFTMFSFIFGSMDVYKLVAVTPLSFPPSFW